MGLKLFLNSCFIIFAIFAITDQAWTDENEDRYFNYSLRLMQAKKPEAAEKVISQGIKKYPLSIKLIYQRAKILGDSLKKYELASNEYSRTIQYAIRAKRIHEFFKAYYRRGDLMVKRGLLGQAVKDYSNCLKLSPKYGKVYFRRARIFYKLGQLERSKRDLAFCIKFSPEYKKAVNNFIVENHIW